MKNLITEFVKFKVLETTTDEQLISKADIVINGFWKKQDGFIDAELVKDVEENSWCFIYHNESLEKLKAGGEKMRSSKEFGDFIPLIVPGSISVTFYHRLRKW
jgi:hypothetical protein